MSCTATKSADADAGGFQARVDKCTDKASAPTESVPCQTVEAVRAQADWAPRTLVSRGVRARTLTVTLWSKPISKAGILNLGVLVG